MFPTKARTETLAESPATSAPSKGPFDKHATTYLGEGASVSKDVNLDARDQAGLEKPQLEAPSKEYQSGSIIA